VRGWLLEKIWANFGYCGVGWHCIGQVNLLVGVPLEGWHRGGVIGVDLSMLWLLQSGVELQLAWVPLGISTSMGEDGVGGLAAATAA